MGLMLYGLSMLRVSSVLHSIRHHSFIRNLSSVLASPVMKYFSCADAPFGSVSAVNMCSDQLVVNAFFVRKIFDNYGSFIVKLLYFWSESLL